MNYRKLIIWLIAGTAMLLSVIDGACVVEQRLTPRQYGQVLPAGNIPGSKNHLTSSKSTGKVESSQGSTNQNLGSNSEPKSKDDEEKEEDEDED